MSVKAFFDTNIFVYTQSTADPVKAARATQLLREYSIGRDAVISYQVIQEFFNVMLTRAKPPMALDDAAAYFANIFLPMETVESSPEVFDRALKLRGRYGYSWYDSLIVAAAVSANCTLLFSEDLHHGQQIDNLKIVNPFV